MDGYNVFLSTIREGLKKNTSHYFFGSTNNVLEKLIKRLEEDFPEINIAGSFSPPVGDYKELTQQKYIIEMQKLNQTLFGYLLGFQNKNSL